MKSVPQKAENFCLNTQAKATYSGDYLILFLFHVAIYYDEFEFDYILILIWYLLKFYQCILVSESVQ